MAIESLGAELNAWYEKHCANGHLSWNVLAKKTGITVSNITKIARGEVERPKYETAKLLLDAILPGRPQEVAEYITATYQGGAITFEKEAESPRTQLSAEAADLLRDSLSFRLFKLSMSGSRAVTELEQDFGVSFVRPRIEALTQIGLVTVDDQGRLKRTAKSKFIFDSDMGSVVTEFKHAIDLVAEKKILARNGVESIDKDANRLASYHCSLKPESAKQMAEDIMAMIRKVAQKYGADQHKGDVEVFFNVALGRFDCH